MFNRVSENPFVPLPCKPFEECVIVPLNVNLNAASKSRASIKLNLCVLAVPPTNGYNAFILVSSELDINPMSNVFNPPRIVASLIALAVKNALVRTVKICAI